MVNTINDQTVSLNNTESIMPTHYLHELPNEDELNLAKLFESLDMDKNGEVDVLDLSSSLHDKEYAQVSEFLFLKLIKVAILKKL